MSRTIHNKFLNYDKLINDKEFIKLYCRRISHKISWEEYEGSEEIAVKNMQYLKYLEMHHHNFLALLSMFTFCLEIYYKGYNEEGTNFKRYCAALEALQDAIDNSYKGIEQGDFLFHLYNYKFMHDDALACLQNYKNAIAKAKNEVPFLVQECEKYFSIAFEQVKKDFPTFANEFEKDFESITGDAHANDITDEDIKKFMANLEKINRQLEN